VSRADRRTALSPLTALTALAALTVACSGERLRPGPPNIVLEFPSGTTVMSPDTLTVVVRANDPNGLDTVSVALRDAIVTLSAFARTELVELVFLQIPTDIPPGTVLTVVATAADLSGLMAQATASLNVVENATSP